MGLFDSKKKRGDEGAGDEKIKFFSQSEYEYKLPDSRRPVVIKKEKPKTQKASKPKKSVMEDKKMAEPKKASKSTAKKDETKKAAKPVAAKTEAKKPAKTTAAKPAVKKVEKTTAAKEKKPVAAKAAAKKAVPAVKAPAAKDTKKSAPKLAAASKAAVSDMIEINATETVTEGKATRNGTFDIKKSKDGRYVFNLYSANKVIIATSQVYSSSQSAMTGVKSVMSNAVKAQIEDTTLKNPDPKPYPKWEIYIDRAGEYRFRLHASNASCVCHAKAGYATKANCKRGIESIIRLAQDAQIDKSYVGNKK